MQRIRIAALAGALAGSALLSLATASASPLATSGTVTALNAGNADLSGMIQVQGNNKVIRAQGNKNGGGNRVGGGGGGGNRVGGGGGGGNRVGGGGGGGNRVGGGGGGGNRVGRGGGGGRGGRGGGGFAGPAVAVGILGAVAGAIAVSEQAKEARRECRRTYGRAYDRETGMVFLRGEQFPCP